MDGLDIATAKWGRDSSGDKALLASLKFKLLEVLPNTPKYLKVGHSFSFSKKNRYIKFIEIRMMDDFFTLNYNAEYGITCSITLVNASDFIGHDVSLLEWFNEFFKSAQQDPVITVDMREHLKAFVPSE